MNYLQPVRLDALARAYALGTMSTRARRRFTQVVGRSAVAAQAVADWQVLLGTLEEGAPRVPAPHPRVWRGVQSRLFARDEQMPATTGAGAQAGAPRTVGWLRWPLGLAGGALLLWSAVALRPQAFGLELASGATPPSYVGALQDPQGRALLTTTARRHGKVLTVHLLQPTAVVPGRALTVWAWSDADPTPHWIASWTSSGETTQLPLATQAEALLDPMSHLGVTSEQAGPAPDSPRHPFIAEGPCGRVW